MENWKKIIVCVFLLMNFGKSDILSEVKNSVEVINDEIRVFLNVSDNSTRDNQRYQYQFSENQERDFESKVNFLSRIFKKHVDELRSGLEEVELVFLVDASASVGLENFRSELNFVKKLLADFTVEPSRTRVAIVTFASRKNVVRNVDQISKNDPESQKCQLLGKQLGNITYAGGGTYTLGALLEAYDILQEGRNDTKKAVFLITDGFSNGGDPRMAARLLKESGATVFTFGIRTGNVEELYDIASEPGYIYSYLLDSFPEFEALARRALHRDLKAGKYVPVRGAKDCDSLCERKINETDGCCDELATCTCGTATGHYSCLCPLGYFGSGLKGSCQACPNGTYGFENIPGDSTSACNVCPDINHITIKIPATDITECVCTSGFVGDGNKCEAITCPKLKVPENGYLVKASACSNVVNAACGVRCRIGFHLTGDSIRLCRKNGTWSGTEPQCLLKTCPSLRAPQNGNISCKHEDGVEQRMLSDSLIAQPIDTQCEFKCENGYQLRGSKVRNCLPISSWDGLRTTCNLIHCKPLPPVTNGEITPSICNNNTKIPFGTNCTINCKEGFELEGPKSKICGGRHGIWSKRHSLNKCVDTTPPSLTCPENMKTTTLLGKNYTLVNWTIPIASDNSEIIPTVWSKPDVTFPWKAEIGLHVITYLAQDESGNQIKCKFFVNVTDNEPPAVENCEDPPVFLSESITGAENVTWDEPVFYDNSGLPIKIEKSHIPGQETFPMGQTQVIYNATDQFGNTKSCIFNITVEDACKDVPAPLNGFAKCQDEEEGFQCVMTCDDGYAFAFGSANSIQSEESLIVTCNSSSRSWNSSFFLDCSVTQVPISVSQEGVIVLEQGEICGNSTLLQNLTESINKDLTSKLLETCGNDIDCTLVKTEPKCEDLTEKSEEDLLRRRKKREMKDEEKEEDLNKKKRKRERIEIKFKFIGKIIEENYNNPREGVTKLREKLELMSQSGQLNLLNGETNQKIANLALNLHTMFDKPLNICKPGSVLKKYDCVKCPIGTFHNQTKNHCQSCRFGEYQDSIEGIECKKCPKHTSTLKNHSRAIKDCIPVCQPGYYSHRKRHYPKLAVEPCTTCEIGTYQPNYGQKLCLPCPENTTTISRTSKNIKDCFYPVQDFCKANLCLNGGICQKEIDGFSCECPVYFIGSRCEKFQHPCYSNPCLNRGDCLLLPNNTYVCGCYEGYTGRNCEHYVDECTENPCKNGGSCKSTESDFICICKEGYEGEFCEIKSSNYCDPSPCEEGSSCIAINGTWHCLCKQGFLGRYCNLLPCDWIPCHPNSICVNIQQPQVTTISYRCECPDGYTGKDCTTRIDYCKNLPCKNGGTCVNGLLNFSCKCLQTFTGLYCETELSSNYIMHFKKSGTTDYVKMTSSEKDILELSVCLWLQSLDKFNYGTVLSYANQIHDNAFTLTDYNGFVLYINGEKTITDITANDGYWHFLCVTWESQFGTWNVYVDGSLKDNGTLLSNRTAIKGNGILIVGQEQDKFGGDFSESESFIGKITLLNIWNSVLDSKTIQTFSSLCENYFGSLFAWVQMQENVHGNIEILESPFCQGCPSLNVPFRGNLSLSKDRLEATYTCDVGYLVKIGRIEQKSLKRKCLLQGQWEGHYTPTCRRVTCKNLLAPEHGDIEYIIEEHERDDTTVLQVGQQLEFKCDSGFRLVGEKILTCLDYGVWDHDIPICSAFGCSSPQMIDNGYISTKFSASNENQTEENTPAYFSGDIVEFSCNPGFKFQVNQNLLGEFRLQCSSTGFWTGFVPDCVPLQCPWPKLLQNGKILLHLENKTIIEIPEKNASNSSLNSTEINIINKENGLFTPGTKISLNCEKGYKNVGESFRICTLNETWTNDGSFCEIRNCSLENHPIVNLLNNFGKEFKLESDLEIDEWKMGRKLKGSLGNFDLFFDGSLSGDKAIFVCRNMTVFRARDSGILEMRWKCEDGRWEFESGDIEENGAKMLFGESGKNICESIICFRPNISNNGYIVNENPEDLEKTFDVDDIINFKCRQGYFLKGSETSRCLSNGSWSEIPVCQSIVCGKPILPPHTEIKYENYTPDEYVFGNMVTYQCVPGYRTFGQVSVRCLANGKWSKMHGKCSKISCGKPEIPSGISIHGSSYLFEDQLIYACPGGTKSDLIICQSDGKWSEPPKCDIN
ncbi:sushi, von Willebrand factor type A, EGF and pentraxin domain-containing protein 1-like isoform X2 [Belonocnema kinseyi]|uniref:sushi, von Willebrand factor type A, EGF and pentraxin domain-containing protein 1-like isoform X2 n=1 Tax=Belonocnema kinseyi TaxID=2817044 RepID=UPI00143D1463|nr:sushi, von Willebrand factor type A, EGF and pentraxin domain-containing protein 1-like isoform X2 [Belonocnema kinseyi]